MLLSSNLVELQDLRPPPPELELEPEPAEPVIPLSKEATTEETQEKTVFSRHRLGNSSPRQSTHESAQPTKPQTARNTGRPVYDPSDGDPDYQSFKNNSGPSTPSANNSGNQPPGSDYIPTPSILPPGQIRRLLPSDLTEDAKMLKNMDDLLLKRELYARSASLQATHILKPHIRGH